MRHKMKNLRLFAIAAASSLLFLAAAIGASSPAVPAKSVTFKIINNSSHTVDLDTDGGPNGECRAHKGLTTCTRDATGKIAIGGHLAVDRSFKHPSGIYGGILSITSEPEDGRNFVLQAIGSSPITATLSTEKWAADKEEVTITVTNASTKK